MSTQIPRHIVAEGLLVLVAISLAAGDDDARPKVATSTASTTPTSAAWRFDGAQQGSWTSLWGIDYTSSGDTPLAAAWMTVADDNAPSPPNILKLKFAGSHIRVFNLLILKAPRLADVDVSVKLRADNGKNDRGGGLIWRCRDKNNYYICRINPLEDNYRVYKMADGKRTQLASVDLKLESGRWYAQRATMVGDQITCFLDGKPLLNATDRAFSEAGRVGLWTKSDAESSFDDFVVSPARREAPEKRR